MKGGWKAYRYITLFYAHNGPGPYLCSFCGKDVLGWWADDDRKTRLAVHHKDDDHSNNDPANLAASHTKCHSRYHTTEAWKNGRVSGLTAVGKAARGRVTSARNRDPAFRKKVSEGKRRWWAGISSERREAIGAKISAGHAARRRT